MGVRILYDVKDDIATLYCSTSCWSFGPLFEGDGLEKAESFCEWFNTGKAREAGARLGMKLRAFPGFTPTGDDPREYEDHDLERLLGEWRDECLDENGNLCETEEVAS